MNVALIALLIAQPPPDAATAAIADYTTIVARCPAGSVTPEQSLAFRSSAERLQRLWNGDPNMQTSGRDPALVIPLARAHLFAGNLPLAIRTVHEGLALCPTSRVWQQELQALRGLVQYPAPSDDGERMTPAPPSGLSTRISARQMYLFGVIHALVLTLGILLRGVWLMRTGTVLAVLGGVGLLATAAIESVTRTATARNIAILREDQVELRRGNGVSYPPRLARRLPLGAEVEVLHMRGDWLQVRLPGGAIGWLPRDSVLPTKQAW